MAENKLNFNNAGGYATPNNQYLNLAGLSQFWNNVSTIINKRNQKLSDDLTKAYTEADTAIKTGVKDASVNGKALFAYSEEGVISANQIELKSGDIALTTEIEGGNVVGVGGQGAAYEKATTVDAALTQLDTRVDAVETAFTQGVVNNITTSEVHNEKEGSDVVYVSINELNKKTGEVELTIDDTAVATKFDSIDQQITTLEANAGVAGIKVVDTDPQGATKNFVAFSFDAAPVKDSEGNDIPVDLNGGFKKGMITLTVDETQLASEISAIHTKEDALDKEDASQKLDIAALAGEGYAAGTEGNAGSWAATPNYPTIKALSDALVNVDNRAVTSIEVVDTPSTEDKDANLITITTEGTAIEGGNAKRGEVKISVDHTALTQRMAGLDAEDAKFAAYAVNGKSLYDAADQAIELYGTDIKRTDAADAKTIAQTLTDIEGKISSLASATEFVGVVDGDPLGENVTITKLDDDINKVAQYEVTFTDGGEKKTMQNGDIVIYGQKEYILDASTSEPHFVELGDTTDEVARLTAIEAWINAPISATEIDDLFGDELTATA